MTAKSKTSDMFTVPIMNWFIITDERVSALIVVISFRLLYLHITITLSNTGGATRGAGTIYSCDAHEFIPSI